MTDNSYLTIQSWMRTDLNLSGNELLVYAIIYGFSQDGVSRFKGSRQYLADWCGCTVRSIQTTLNNMVDKGLIIKYENNIGGVKLCEYATNFTTSEKISPPSEIFSHNNIDNNKRDINNNSKELLLNEQSEYESHMYSADDFLGSSKKKTTKGKNLFSKCVDEIDKFTDLGDLRDALINYLTFRLSVKDKPLYGVNQWKAMLNKLDKAVEECHREYIDVVNNSLDKGWLNFYPIQSGKPIKKDVFSEYGEVTCERKDEKYVDRNF